MVSLVITLCRSLTEEAAMIGLETFNAPVLVGREEELRAVLQALTTTRLQHGQALLIRGEMGLGKTRLCEHFLSQARAAQVPCLTGAAFAVEADLPYNLFLSVLEDAQAHPRPATSAPSAATPLHRHDDDGSAPGRDRIFDTFAAMLRRPRSGQPAIIFLDDIHWADSHSLTLLHFLTRHVRGSDVLILATYRPEEAVPGSRLYEVVFSLRRLGAVQEIVLRPLDLDAVQQMVKQVFHYHEDLSPAFLDLLYRQTQGNPLFVEETLRSLVAKGHVYLQGGRWWRRPLRALEVPPTLKDALLMRLSGITPAARSVLDMAAVIGGTVEYALLLTTTGLPAAQLDPLLVELCRLGLLVEAAAPSLGYQLVHPVLERTLYDSLNEVTRRGYHHAVAATLEARAEQEQTKPWAALGRHLAGANDALCHTRLAHAAEHAWSTGALEDASTLYDLALRCTPDPGAPAYLADWSRLARARAWIGDLEGAAQAWEAALAAGEAAADPAHRTVAHRELGAIKWECGEEPAALNHFRAALRATDGDGAGDEDRRLRIAIARSLCEVGRWAEAEHLSAEALPPTCEPDADDIMAEASQVLFLRAGMRGDRTGMDAFAENLLVGERARPAVRWRSYLLLARLADLQGQSGLALRYLAPCRELSATLRSPVYQALHDELLGVVLFHRGEWTAALAALGRAMDAFREWGLRLHLARTEAMAATLLLYRGRTTLAHEYLEEARRLVEQQPVQNVLMLVPILLALALGQLLARRPAAAYACARQVLTLVDEQDWSLIALNGPYALASHAAIRAGELDAAADQIERLRTLAANGPHLVGQAFYWQERGRLQQARGNVQDALTAFERSAATWALLERPFEEAANRFRLALACRQTGETDRGSAALLTSEQLLQRLGAEPLIARVRRALGELGVTPGRRPAGRQQGEVTDRERELIALVAERAGTDEIAHRLVISPATVRTHLRNIFRKLGATSRAELVMIARQRRLVD